MTIEYHCYQPLLIGLPHKSNHKWCCSNTWLFFRVTPLPAVKSEGSWIGFPTNVIFLLVTVTGRVSILIHAETASKALSKYSPSPLLWTETPWQHNLLKRHRKYDNKHQHPKNSDYPHSHQRSIEWPAFWHHLMAEIHRSPTRTYKIPSKKKTGWNYQLSTGAQFWPSTNYIKVKDQRKGLSKSILVGLVPSIFDILTNAYIEGLPVNFALDSLDVHRFSSPKEWPQPYSSPCSIIMTLPCRYWSSRLSFWQSVVANHGGYYW